MQLDPCLCCMYFYCFLNMSVHSMRTEKIFYIFSLGSITFIYVCWGLRVSGSYSCVIHACRGEKTTVEVSSLLLPFRPWRVTSSCQAWQQVLSAIWAILKVLSISSVLAPYFLVQSWIHVITSHTWNQIICLCAPSPFSSTISASEIKFLLPISFIVAHSHIYKSLRKASGGFDSFSEPISKWKPKLRVQERGISRDYSASDGPS